MAEYYRDHREVRRIQHAERRQSNAAALRAAGVRFEVRNEGAVLLLREPGKPAVDYYPGTGRWRVRGIVRTFGGRAGEFLNWYRKQSASESPAPAAWPEVRPVPPDSGRQ